jgi:glutamine synthetase
MVKMVEVEYVWLDGNTPARLRSKKKTFFEGVLDSMSSEKDMLDKLRWSFDGSSTGQADGENSDIILQPLAAAAYDEASMILICECLNPDGTPAKGNYRAELKKLIEDHNIEERLSPWVGFEQEYVIYDRETHRPLGWPKDPKSQPNPQGDYYCGVDGDVCFGRIISDNHLKTLIKYQFNIYGTNAEVMPGQWEYQIGVRNGEIAIPDVLEMCDQLVVSRFLLFKEAEKHNCYISLACKPEKTGEWNGSGMHVNFSTKEMRDEKNGKKAIVDAIEKLEKRVEEHIDVYGVGVKERLTGKYETAPWNVFSSGVANRNCSVRIPREVYEQGYGYLEDRRPGANSDPYQVCKILLETICT